VTFPGAAGGVTAAYWKATPSRTGSIRTLAPAVTRVRTK
jgi:hypothetical protein